MPRTKIVCTLGPVSQSEEVLREMIRAGMDVARVNFSHGDRETHVRSIALVRRLAEEEGKVVAVMQDLQGPRVRVGEIKGGKVMLKEGRDFTLTTRQVLGDEREVTVLYPRLPQEVRTGDHILLDDGLLDLEVVGATDTDVCCRVVTGGVLRSRKGITLPHSPLSLPSLTDKDKEDLLVGVENEVDYIALSFVRCAEDILELKKLLAKHGAQIPVIAKIEKREAVANFDEILSVSDGAMVARGDLGVETPAEMVPIYQKMIIKKCNQVGKPVITATQMLDSMIHHPRPTRAEASDVANAILDGTDALMLSGETAVGKYPVESVRIMAKIATTTERELPLKGWFVSEHPSTLTDAIGRATCEMAAELSAKAIITPTTSGYTARMVAKYRPVIPIIAPTPVPETRRRLALVWGVYSLLVRKFTTTDEMIATTVQAALDEGLVKKGDLVVITAGVPMGGPGRTNMIKVHLVQ